MEYILSASGVKYLDLIEYPEINIEENKMTFICGESGVGKTTLFRLFNGTVSPSEGKILFRGTDISETDTISLRRKICLVSQEPYLFEGTVKDNFDTYYSYRGDAPPGEEEIKHCLSVCCADFPVERNCLFLSGGEKQRLFTAIFLSFSPEVILLDEPTSALDEITANRLMSGIREHCQKNGITALVISHDKRMLSRFADSVITLERRHD